MLRLPAEEYCILVQKAYLNRGLNLLESLASWFRFCYNTSGQACQLSTHFAINKLPSIDESDIVLVHVVPCHTCVDVQRSIEYEQHTSLS